MKLMNPDILASRGVRSNNQFSAPLSFLPLVVDALKDADVSCRHCSVKLISRTGLVGGLCPSCFEERCAKCGENVHLANGELAPGLTVGRGGSWLCVQCAGPRSRKREVKRKS